MSHRSQQHLLLVAGLVVRSLFVLAFLMWGREQGQADTRLPYQPLTTDAIVSGETPLEKNLHPQQQNNWT